MKLYLVVDEWRLSSCDNGVQYDLFDSLEKAKEHLQKCIKEVKQDLVDTEDWYNIEESDMYCYFYGEDYAYSHNVIKIVQMEVK